MVLLTRSTIQHMQSKDGHLGCMLMQGPRSTDHSQRISPRTLQGGTAWLESITKGTLGYSRDGEGGLGCNLHIKSGATSETSPASTPFPVPSPNSWHREKATMAPAAPHVLQPTWQQHLPIHCRHGVLSSAKALRKPQCGSFFFPHTGNFYLSVLHIQK